MRLREIKHGRLAMAAFAFHYAGVLLEKKGVVVRVKEADHARACKLARFGGPLTQSIMCFGHHAVCPRLIKFQYVGRVFS